MKLRKKMLCMVKQVKKITIFACLVCVVYPVAGIQSFSTPKDDLKMLYAYNITRNSDYKVYLKKNEFINQEYMGMNATYITDLVNYIDANFRYNYNISKPSVAKCTYKIVADLNVEYYVTGSSRRNQYMV